jgi:3-oxoacyl-[acyl-carrier protein] reductase
MTDEDWMKSSTPTPRRFLCTRAALRGMIRQRWGRIVNMSSIVGRTGNADRLIMRRRRLGSGYLPVAEVATRNITVIYRTWFIETEMTGSLTEAQQRWLLIDSSGNAWGQSKR